jgi:hypothetical protein
MKLVQQVRAPASKSYPAITSKTIARDAKAAERAACEVALEAAATRADEPVKKGMLLFILQDTCDIGGGFGQPLALVVVTDIFYADLDDAETGSTNPHDKLAVQYFTSTGYDKQYSAAAMPNCLVTQQNENRSKDKQLRRNEIYFETVSRAAVVMVDVRTNKNKDEGTGTTKPTPVPLKPGSRVKFMLCGRTTKKMLKEKIPEAEYSLHSGTKADRDKARTLSEVRKKSKRKAPKKGRKQQQKSNRRQQKTRCRPKDTDDSDYEEEWEGDYESNSEASYDSEKSEDSDDEFDCHGNAKTANLQNKPHYRTRQRQ